MEIITLTRMSSFLTRLFKRCKILSLVLLFGGCTSQKEINPIEQIVESWYNIYQERSDFQKFLALYDEKIILEDIILGEKKMGKTDFAAFFDWGNPGFSKTEASAIVVTSKIVNGQEAVLKGYFTPFKWGDETYEAMHFTTLLSFNETNKIIKQVDWINYPNELLDYSSRGNANHWLKDH